MIVLKLFDKNAANTNSRTLHLRRLFWSALLIAEKLKEAYLLINKYILCVCLNYNMIKVVNTLQTLSASNWQLIQEDTLMGQLTV